MTCPTCNGVAYEQTISGMVPCRFCEAGRKIQAGIELRIAKRMKKRGITPPAPRKASVRPPMWNETKESE